MKLYAKTSSERATKGQGGNKYLNIELFIGEADYPQFIGKVKLCIHDNDYILEFHPAHPYMGIVELLRVSGANAQIKGKRQKGEQKCYCGSSELPNEHFKKDCKNPY